MSKKIHRQGGRLSLRLGQRLAPSPNVIYKYSIQFKQFPHLMKCLFIILMLYPGLILAQKKEIDTNYIYWSKDRKLKQEDFLIKTANNGASSSAMFGSEYNLTGIFSMQIPKNYKEKIRHYFVRNASWIDTTANFSDNLTYQQTQFDLCEIYFRKFRKEVNENKKKIFWGKLAIRDINNKILADYRKRVVIYDQETKSGNLPDKQQEWELIILKELEELSEFGID
ncbi:hypothetical protein [Pedobacter sp.]